MKTHNEALNKFVIYPKTFYWLMSTGFNIRKSYSSEWSIPMPNKKVKHFNWQLNTFNKYFGLQSYFVAEK